MSNLPVCQVTDSLNTAVHHVSPSKIHFSILVSYKSAVILHPNLCHKPNPLLDPVNPGHNHIPSPNTVHRLPRQTLLPDIQATSAPRWCDFDGSAVGMGRDGLLHRGQDRSETDQWAGVGVCAAGVGGGCGGEEGQLWWAVQMEGEGAWVAERRQVNRIFLDVEDPAELKHVARV